MSRNRLLGVFAAAGFATSCLVHVSTFYGVSLPHRVPALWLLHVGVFVVFAPAVFAIRAENREGRLKELASSYPPSVIALAVALNLYVCAAGAAAFSEMKGVAEERPSGYVLVNRGEFIRELTYEEYTRARALRTRGFSAVWVGFYGVSALFWLSGGRRAS